MAHRHGEMLTVLSGLGMALAREVQGRALTAKDDGALCELSLAFHRISRSVRQTLALESRMERERRVGAREDAREAERVGLARMQKKRAQVRAALSRDIWNEAEDDEAEALLEDLEDRLRDETLADSFLDAPVEVCIERIRADLGLAAANTTDDDAQIAPDLSPSVVIWRSSG